MARGDDLPQGPRRGADRSGPRGGDEARPLSEQFVADAAMRRRGLELTAELEQARVAEAQFEQRHGMTFEEFQARFDPRADADLSDDYLEWSRAAERVRMLRHELARLGERGARRLRSGDAGGQSEEQPGRERPC